MEWRQFASRPLCAKQAVVQGEKYRITVLTARLFRLEYSEDGVFEDRPTQCVLNRDFPVPQFRVFETDGSLKIVTEGVVLLYDKQKFSPSGLSLTVKSKGNAHNGVWHYGEEAGDLRGTARTLDNADGAVELEHGLLSDWGGYSLLDDSRSLLIRPDGWVEPRQGERIDLYFFGYGRDYQACLRDFYHLTGPAPMLPRYALGNWWSRFHRYDEAEYKALMERFEAEQVPFSVAVIDMDWHLVSTPPTASAPLRRPTAPWPRPWARTGKRKSRWSSTSPTPASWTPISSTSTTPTSRPVWTSGGWTGSRAPGPASPAWTPCGC